MIPLLRNNYLRLTDKIELDKLPSVYSNYYQETLTAFEQVVSLKQGKLYLLYSGGVDSEYALSVLLAMGVDVTPVIVKLNPNYNYHEIQYAFKFCESKNLTPLVIDIDFDKFVTSGKILDLARSMNINIFHYSATAHAVSLLDGTVLLGDGEPYIRLVDDFNWNVELHEYEFGIGNHFINQGIHGTPYLLRYTPEMMISFLNSQRIKELADNLHPGKLGSHSSKVFVYNEHSNFNLEIRTKQHGYEFIEKSEIFKHDVFKEFKHWHSGIKYSKNYYKFLCEQ
jgi:hypothetical protein